MKKKPQAKKGTAARSAAKAKAPMKSKTPVKAKASAKSAKSAAMDPCSEEMMALWQQAMTPGAGHRRLEPLAGTWNTRTTFVMDPSAPPTVSTGTSEHRLVLGGRYLEQTYRGTVMDMPFEGLGYTGFDNIQGCYVGSWMDTFGTGIMTSIGTGKPSDKTMTFEATCFEPGKKLAKFRTVILIHDRDHHAFEMWRKLPGGKEFRAMLVEYTRK